MRCYFLDIHLKSFFAEHRTTASTKPRTDAIKIAKSVGFKPIVLYYLETGLSFFAKRHPLFPNRLLNIQLWLLCKLVRNSVIMVQLPFLRHNMYGAIERLHNHNKILVLVHDVESIRATADGTWDLYVLKLANAVIVHTPMMAQVLHDNGVFAHCISLEFFDYISDCSREPSVITNNPVVVFAGNLMRCDFLKKLHDLSPKYRMQMYLYGKETAFEFPDNVKYKGFFDNENISYVDGDWGLVWDGDDIVTCSGNLGEYLKYNSSFKFSLYLALSIPVIVWSQSAMAKYVREYHLGICVDSLNGIRSGIQNLSQEEIEHIKISIGIYSQKVKTGQMLTAAINKALSVIKSDESTL